MEAGSLNLVFIAWLVGLVTLPLWLYPIGRSSARARERLEAPHRHPRPAVDALRPASEGPADRATLPAFVDGYAATSGARLERPDEIPRLLEERYDVIGELEELSGDDGAYRVSLVESVNGHRPAGGATCAYDRGVLAGLFSALLAAPVDVKESACVSDGAARCAFDVRVLRDHATVDAPPEPRAAAEGAWRLLRWTHPTMVSRRRAARAATADQDPFQRSRKRW